MLLINNIRSFVMKENYDFDRPDATLYNFHPQLRICYAINGVFYNNRKSVLRFIIPVLNILIGLIASAFEMMFIWRGVMTEDYAFATESFCYVVILGTVPIVYTSILVNGKILIDLMDHMNNDFIFISKLGTVYQKIFLKGQLLIWSLCWAWFGFCGFISVMYIGNTVLLLLYQSLLATQSGAMAWRVSIEMRCLLDGGAHETVQPVPSAPERLLTPIQLFVILCFTARFFLKDEHMIRPLIFPIWLPEDDPYRTPNYEIFICFQIILIGIILVNFGVYVYTQFHIFLHYYVIMDLIIMDVLSLFDGMANHPLPPEDGPIFNAIRTQFKAKIARVVTWHVSVFKSMDTISTVYGPPLVYQVMFSSVAICIMAYQVADQLEHGKLDYLFSLLWLGTCVQLWIPCYLGTLMRNKAFSIGHACWNCGWETTPISRMLRTDLTIIMLRSQKPLTIQFTGLPSLTLETFSSVMSTSYSYFNMLRQSTR